MAIQGFFTGDVKIRDLNGVLKAVDGIVEVATDAGTVTSVGLTVGSTGTDVNVANSPITSSGNITLNLPTASATNRGLLSSADWTTFNNKQAAGNYVTLDTYQTITASKTFSVGFNLASVGGTNQPTFFENTNNLHSGSVGSNIFGFNTDNNIYFGKGSDNGGVLQWNNSEVRYYTLPNANGTIALVGGAGVGTVTSVAALTLGTSGTDLSSTVANSTTTPVITLNVPTASATNRGALSSADWTTFNSKQGAITLTTTGSSGAATLIGTTLNIPNYTPDLSGYVPTSRQLTINGTTYDLSANRSWSVGTVTSVGITMPSAFAVSSSPVTGSGTIAVTGAGLASQYVRGDGTLGDFPGGGGGGGASVAYYLNGSVNQGTFGGTTYYEMNKTPIIGAGTDFTINTNGYIASFLTDAGDPALLNIPGGNWNLELYFSSSSSGGSPSFYVELYKYDGTTFTLLASNSTSPEAITNGTTIDLYFTAISVPTTTLAVTDRLAIRVYVNNSGRTITLHTENSHLCEVITTFSTGLTALNGLTAQVQYLTTGTSGTDFNIVSATATHTFNLPTASATNRGALSSADWTTFNNKQNALTNPITGTGTSGQVAYFNGTNSITSNAAFAFTPTSQLLVNNSVTAASAIARGTNLTPTLTAAANNDVLVGLDINPTFTNGAFTGVTNYILRGFGANGANVILGGQQNNSGTSTINIYGTNRLDRSAFITATAAGSFSNNVLNFGLNYFDGTSLLTDNYITLSARTTTINFPFLLNNPLIYPSSNNTNSSLSFGNGTQNVRGAAIFAMASGASGITARLDFAISNATNPSVTTSDVAMSLFNSKNFGIGTTTDSGFRLDVNGTARVQGNTYIINGTNQAFLYLSSDNTSYLRGNGSNQMILGVAGGLNTTINFSSSLILFGNNAGANLRFETNTGRLSMNGGSLANTQFAITDDNSSIQLVLRHNTANTQNYLQAQTLTGTIEAAITNGGGAFFLGDVGIGTSTFGTATKFTLGGSETASSAIARGQLLNTTLVAAANNDVLVGLDINPTFTNGAFTGVENWATRIQRNKLLINSTTDNNIFPLVIRQQNYSGLLVQNSFTGTNHNSSYNGFAFWLNNDSATFKALINNWNSTGISIFNGTSTGSGVNIFGSTNNVGINQTTDAGFRLDVNGTARVQGELTVNTVAIGLGGGAIATNTRVGVSALQGNTTGNSNTAIGHFSLGQTTITGTFNTGVGINTVRYVTSGSVNTGIGGNALINVSTGSSNTAVGVNALQGITTASNNTALGRGAGGFISGGSVSNLTGSNSIFIGHNAFPLADAQTNQIVIGYDTVGLGSNTTVLGNASTTLTALYGSVITGGTSINASAQLQVDSTSKGFLVSRMTSAQRVAIASPATGLLVYQTDGTEGFYVYSGGSWKSLTMTTI